MEFCTAYLAVERKKKIMKKLGTKIERIILEDDHFLVQYSNGDSCSHD